MAQAVTDIADRARNKKLTPDEVQGGTFTITNPGGYGTFHGTPVISQPQAAILGTYALVKRPWVVQDSFGKDVIAIRPIMNITLTYDHRLVDGALAGRFLKDLKEALETWDEVCVLVEPRPADSRPERDRGRPDPVALKFERIESMQRPTDVGAGSIGGSGAMSGSARSSSSPRDLEPPRRSSARSSAS